MEMDDFNSDGSDIEVDCEVDCEVLDHEREDEDDFVPDPLDRAQEWDLWDSDEEDDDFRGFQVDWRTDNYKPRAKK